MVKLLLPDLGEGIEKAVVSCWYFQAGDTVQEGEDVVEVTTDKATFNIPAPSSGVIRQTLVAEGQEVAVGTVLATYE